MRECVKGLLYNVLLMVESLAKEKGTSIQEILSFSERYIYIYIVENVKLDHMMVKNRPEHLRYRFTEIISGLCLELQIL